jgi:succinate-semialdehyde dehydrogenase/glutarate-semialdehyde dehydrogenase
LLIGILQKSIYYIRTMNYATVSPVNNEILKEFAFDAFPDLDMSQQAFKTWRKLSVEERGLQMRKVAVLLERNKKRLAELITLEMGKTFAEAEYEIAKTLTAFDYYIEHAPHFLAPEVIKSNATKSYVSFEPLGIIFAVMPWNFPFWQVFRFAVPTLMAGNVAILKHAPNVPQCAHAIQQMFEEAGITPHIFRNYFLSNEHAAAVIADPRVHGLSFTGSDTTGSTLAALAGKSIKKCVMELGGNDAFIVLPDADLELAVSGAIKSRGINSGQACNGAKRFILTEPIAEDFTAKLIKAVLELKVGDPTDDTTNVGPLARRDLQQKVLTQIEKSIAAGAVAHARHFELNTNGNWVAPTVLTNVKPGMPAFDEEIFGPVWSVMVVKNEAEAIEIANKSVYGLGASVWTQNAEHAEQLVQELEAGNVFINAIVKSDARLPFGGIKRSGFGRELSEYSLKEFVNIKTVYIN